jgi:radical SAM superfamily enzyme YgiQ (UPF0313 family)
MKVLLLQPPIEDFYLTEIRTYPLGLLYLGSFLKKNDIDVTILDCLSPYKKKTITLPKQFSYLKQIYSEKEIGPLKLFGAYYRFGLSDDEILDNIGKSKTDYIGITCNFTAYFNIVAELTRKIKERFPKIKIVIGGYHATVYQKEISERYPWIDHVIKGADENEFLKVLGLPLDNDNCFTKNIPDRILINSSNYQMHRKNFSFIVATRGCPKRCTFCTVASMHGDSFVLRPVDNVIDEMQNLYSLHGVRVFDFEDDNLSLNRVWFKELLDKIVAKFPQSDIQLYAMNGISVETLSLDLLQKMWRAGFRNLNVSLVTAQDAIKQKLNRPFTNEQFELIVREAVSLGYEVTAYLIIGLLEQTKIEINETIEYLAKMGVLIAPSFYYPPPGTIDFDWLVKEGRIDKDNWISFRSSVFPVETEYLKREDLVYYFQYIRLLNFSEELKKKYQLTQLNLNNLEAITALTFTEMDSCKASEEEIGIVQLKEYFATGIIKRVFRK